jgi:hypothetical protein
MADRNTGSCSRATDVCPAQLVCVQSYSRLWWPVPRPGMKGKQLLRNDLSVFQASVLGLPCKVETRFRIVHFSRRLRLLISFAT